MKTTQWPCLIFLLVLIIIALAVGGYYTIMHPKQIHLASCYHKGGSCLELENCEKQYQSRILTTCINKRKVCCMPEVQQKNVVEEEVDYPELPFNL